VQLYRYFVSQSSEFCRHNPLCCFSTSDTKGTCIFSYRLSPKTFGCTLVLFVKNRIFNLTLSSVVSVLLIGSVIKIFVSTLNNRKDHWRIKITKTTFENTSTFQFCCHCGASLDLLIVWDLTELLQETFEKCSEFHFKAVRRVICRSQHSTHFPHCKAHGTCRSTRWLEMK
jgi:hypothetical protein